MSKISELLLRYLCLFTVAVGSLLVFAASRGEELSHYFLPLLLTWVVLVIALAMLCPPSQAVSRLTLLKRKTRWRKLEGVNLSDIAEVASGLSRREIKCIPKQAARLAKQRGGRKIITQQLLEEVAMMIDTEGTHTSRAQKLVAAHESGHTLLAHLSPYKQLIGVKTVPGRRSDGFTCVLALDNSYQTQDSIVWEIALVLAGREAEIMLLGQTHFSSSNDIQLVTNVALRAVCREALFDSFVEYIDVTSWTRHPRKAAINRAVRALIEEGRQKAIQELEKNKTLLHEIFEALQQKQFLHRNDIVDLATSVEQAA